MQTVIYYGDINEQQKARKCTFSDVCEMVYGVEKSNRLTVEESVELRVRLSNGDILTSKAGWQIWMEEK